MKTNPLKKLYEKGQSIWLDYIRRDLIADGELRLLTEENGLRYLTSNPAIAEIAIAESTHHEKILQEIVLAKKNAKTITKLQVKAMYKMQQINSGLVKFIKHKTV